MTGRGDAVPPAAAAPAGRVLLYAHTLRHLRWCQLRNQLARRLLPRRLARPVPAGAVRLVAGVAPRTPFLAPPAPVLADGQIGFVGIARAFDPVRPDWQAAEAPKLWRYNLHYFDFLHWPHFGRSQQAALIEDWIASVPPGTGDGWEPYPLSLRVVNWLKFFGCAGPVPEHWVASLGHQLETLRGDLEYHLLANHLFKNAKALVYGGLYMQGELAERWRREGLALLLAEARAQFLPDGGHVERSPMYHAIMLEDLLDVLAVDAPAPVDPAVRGELEAIARQAARFFGGILHADGEIPLFNDAVLGITAPARELLGYAERVLGAGLWSLPPLWERREPRPGGVEACAPPTVGRAASSGGEAVRYPDSGYFGYRIDGESLIVDCGPVGPDYQPGHAHCDTLSYELCLDGRRVVVDSGVFDYEAGELRHALRSTAAHNTVRVDGAEQSEIWGAFRVARRARPLWAEAGGAGAGFRFAGAHDGYRRLPGAVVHEREIVVPVRGEWRVTERLRGSGRHRAESFVHLAPGLVVRAAGDGMEVLDAGRPLLAITPFGRVAVRCEEGWYCPRFGERERNVVVVIEWSGDVPAEFGYELRQIAPTGVHPIDVGAAPAATIP